MWVILEVERIKEVQMMKWFNVFGMKETFMFQLIGSNKANCGALIQM